MRSAQPPATPEPSQQVVAGAVPAIVGSGADRGVAALDGWIVPPHTADRRKRGRGSDGRTRPQLPDDGVRGRAVPIVLGPDPVAGWIALLAELIGRTVLAESEAREERSSR